MDAMQISPSRDEVVGRFRVRRALPRPGRRTVGAWCFADHMGPAEVAEHNGLDVGPHPHCGLQTVTWLVAGEALHRDSLGTEQLIAPGQLNLMTAGHGVSHAEEAAGSYRGPLQGLQLWVAQPEATRHGPPAFEHHADLPQLALDGAEATVLVGEFGGAHSPARHDTPLVGVDLDLYDRTTAPLRADFEHCIIVLEGALVIDGELLEPGHLGHLGIGRDELSATPVGDTRAVLLGGEPFPTPILMWWNYVARTRDEIDLAHRSWETDDGRFGTVHSDLARIPSRRPFWQEQDSPA
ncbi:MAG: putative signal peptide protein [Actinomycetota bacterium]